VVYGRGEIEADVPAQVTEVGAEFWFDPDVVSESLETGCLVRAGAAGVGGSIEVVADFDFDRAALGQVKEQALTAGCSPGTVDADGSWEDVLPYDGAPVLVEVGVLLGDLGGPHQIVEFEARAGSLDESDLFWDVVGVAAQQNSVKG
jgi:hypothetical protein